MHLPTLYEQIFKYCRELFLLLKAQLFIKRFHLIASRSYKIARFHARLFGGGEHLLDKARSIAFPLVWLQNGDFFDFSNVFVVIEIKLSTSNRFAFFRVADTQLNDAFLIKGYLRSSFSFANASLIDNVS